LVNAAGLVVKTDTGASNCVFAMGYGTMEGTQLTRVPRPERGTSRIQIEWVSLQPGGCRRNLLCA